MGGRLYPWDRKKRASREKKRSGTKEEIEQEKREKGKARGEG